MQCWSLLFICFPCIKLLPHAMPRAGLEEGFLEEAWFLGSAQMLGKAVPALKLFGLGAFPMVGSGASLSAEQPPASPQSSVFLGSGTRGTSLSFPTQPISLLGGAKRLSPKRCVSRPSLKSGCSESRVEKWPHSSIFSALQVVQMRGDCHPQSCSDHSSHHNIPFGSTHLCPLPSAFPFRPSWWSVRAAHGGMLTPACPQRTSPFPPKVP